MFILIKAVKHACLWLLKRILSFNISFVNFLLYIASFTSSKQIIFKIYKLVHPEFLSRLDLFNVDVYESISNLEFETHIIATLKQADCQQIYFPKVFVSRSGTLKIYSPELNL